MIQVNGFAVFTYSGLQGSVPEWNRSIKDEILNRMIFFGTNQLDREVRAYLEFYHRERNHQGLANRLIDPEEFPAEGDIVCRERLGGFLKYYHRAV